MNKKEKFESFLESLKGNGEDKLIESVKKGFQVCYENNPIGQRQRDEAFWEETHSEMEEESPVVEEEVIDIKGHKVYLLHYDSGRTQAWVKGIGNIASLESWEGMSREDFLKKVESKLP